MQKKKAVFFKASIKYKHNIVSLGQYQSTHENNEQIEKLETSMRVMDK